MQTSKVLGRLVRMLAFAQLAAMIFIVPAFAAMPLPDGQQQFPAYTWVETPLRSDDPSEAKPIGLGTAANGGPILRLAIGLNQRSAPTDLYVGIYAPALSSELFIVTPTGSLQPLSAGLPAWKTSVVDPVDEQIFADIPVSLLPDGDYVFYLLMTPAGTFSRYDFWSSYFTKSTWRPDQKATSYKGTVKALEVNYDGSKRFESTVDTTFVRADTQTTPGADNYFAYSGTANVTIYPLLFYGCVSVPPSFNATYAIRFVEGSLEIYTDVEPALYTGSGKTMVSLSLPPVSFRVCCPTSTGQTCETQQASSSDYLWWDTVSNLFAMQPDGALRDRLRITSQYVSGEYREYQWNFVPQYSNP